MSLIREKKARFFRAYLLDQGQRVDAPQVDWQAILEALADLDSDDRTTAEGVRFETHEVDDVRLLGIHKPMDPAFLGREDVDTKSIVDVMQKSKAEDEDREAEKLFISSAVHFFTIGNAFALSQGGVGGLRQGAVASFMDRHAAAGPGRHWRVEPIIDESQIDEFRGANRAKAVESTIDSRRLLVDDANNLTTAPEGIATLPDDIAVAIGGDVKVTLKIELLPESQNLMTQRNLYDQVRRGLARLVGPKSGTKVTTVQDDGTNEVLELAAHDLAASFEVDARESEVVQFSTLLRELSLVGAEMENRVQGIIEGVDDGDEQAEEATG